MNKEKNKRLISGNRVFCRCSLELPNIDVFNNYKNHQKGLMIFNTRGGSLYIANQYNERTITKLFSSGKASIIKNLAFHPDGEEPIILGEVPARFLKFTNGGSPSGMVLRFVNLTETQLDVINILVEHLPNVSNDENNFVRQVLR